MRSPELPVFAVANTNLAQTLVSGMSGITTSYVALCRHMWPNYKSREVNETSGSFNPFDLCPGVAKWLLAGFASLFLACRLFALP